MNIDAKCDETLSGLPEIQTPPKNLMPSAKKLSSAKKEMYSRDAQTGKNICISAIKTKNF